MTTLIIESQVLPTGISQQRGRSQVEETAAEAQAGEGINWYCSVPFAGVKYYFYSQGNGKKLVQHTAGSGLPSPGGSTLGPRK